MLEHVSHKPGLMDELGLALAHGPQRRDAFGLLEFETAYELAFLKDGTLRERIGVPARLWRSGNRELHHLTRSSLGRRHGNIEVDYVGDRLFFTGLDRLGRRLRSGLELKGKRIHLSSARHAGSQRNC